MYSSISHTPPTPIIGGIWGCQGLEEGGEKIPTFDAWPSCSDKILKQFSAHSAVTTLQIFCFKIKGWPPPTAAILHLSPQLLSLCLTCSSCLLLTLSRSCSCPSAHIFLRVPDWESMYDCMSGTIITSGSTVGNDMDALSCASWFVSMHLYSLMPHFTLSA